MSRSVKRSGPVPGRLPSPAAIRLTRRDVIRRELASAIRLFIAGGDPVPIHVLASAASAVMQHIAKAEGLETWRTGFLDIVIKEEHRRDGELLVGEWFNFMKHGGSDPEAELASFNPRINEVLLFMLCRDSSRVFRELFPEASFS